MSSEDREPSVQVSLSKIYDEVCNVSDAVRLLVAQQQANEKARDDHEERLRKLEGARWPLPALSIVISVIIGIGEFVMLRH